MPETQENVRDVMEVRKDSVKKPNCHVRTRRISNSRIPWVRYGFVASLTFLAVSASVLMQPVLGSAAEPLDETRVLASPTTVQVTPPPRGTATSQPPLDDPAVKDKPVRPTGRSTPIQGWLLPSGVGVLVWVAGGIVLVALALLLLYARYRRHSALNPLQISSVPLLKSLDGNIYFRLDGLNGDGLVIGRGRRGVDLRIVETTPFVETVSIQHARIYYNAIYDSVIIEDLNSTNGVFINGRQAPRKNLLKDGCVVGLGNVTLTYHDGESDTGPLD